MIQQNLIRRFSKLPLSPLTAISPVDGRYARVTESLRQNFSEFGLFKNRVLVEVKWLQHLSENNLLPKKLNDRERKKVQSISNEFDLTSAERIKEIEKTTNHDVKAVEYFVKERIEELSSDDDLHPIVEFVHFGCTSEDVNNLSYALMLNDSKKVVSSHLNNVLSQLRIMSTNTADKPMLSRTHGQSATPTTLGKEVANYVNRIERCMKILNSIPVLGKFNGAVGNFASHKITFPDVDWPKVSKDFIQNEVSNDRDYTIEANEYSTQIEPHDALGSYSAALAQVNVVLLDLSRDFWGYISLGYLSQKTIATEIGSSTMPHKVNPIDFENAEGNLGLSNALLNHFSSKLPVSRYQRDLSDSTVLRSIGTAISHSVIAYTSLAKGLNKVDANEKKMMKDLEDNVEVLAEAIQMVMRRYQVPGAYEKLKELSRGKRLTLDEVKEFVHTLDIPVEDKNRLLALTPATYTGLSLEQAKRV
eukprot:snap_masked-scaffold_12-processed-gene-1.31-mRNA-1 protein AED:0.15 eAED:0.15 QI:0/-1/0/1/-1/1/1/0/474